MDPNTLNPANTNLILGYLQQHYYDEKSSARAAKRLPEWQAVEATVSPPTHGQQWGRMWRNISEGGHFHIKS